MKKVRRSVDLLVLVHFVTISHLESAKTVRKTDATTNLMVQITKTELLSNYYAQHHVVIVLLRIKIRTSRFV